MSHTLSSRSTSNRLIVTGCLLMSFPCVIAVGLLIFFYWPVLLPGGR